MSSLAAIRPRSPDAETRAPSGADRGARWLAIGAPAALGLGLCLWALGSRSLGFDEAASVTIAAQHGGALWHAIAHDGGNMAGYYLLLHLCIAIFGDGLVAVRVLSAVSVTATVALTGALAARLFGSRVATLAGTLAAVSLPLVYWGQTARGYAPMIALTTGSMLAFVALVETRCERPVSKTAWIAYAVTTALAIYCSFVAVLIVPVQLLALFWRHGAARRVLTALVASALGCVPLLVLALTRGSGQLFWVPRPTTKLELQVLETLTSAALRPNFHLTATSVGLLVLSLLLIIGAALAARTWRARLIVGWLVVPVGLAWIESLVGQSIFVPRNLLVGLPAAAILLALAVSHPRIPWGLGLALLATVLVLRAHQLVASYGVSPEEWKGAAHYVLARAAPGDCVAFYPQDARMPFDYYARHPSRRTSLTPVLPSAPWVQVAPYVEDYRSFSTAQIARLPARCPRLWLVWSHAGQPDGPRASLLNLTRLHALRAALARPYRPRAVRRFGYAAVIYVELLSART